MTNANIASLAHAHAARLSARMPVIEFPIAAAALCAHLAGLSGAQADLYIDRMAGHLVNLAAGTKGR